MFKLILWNFSKAKSGHNTTNTIKYISIQAMNQQNRDLTKEPKPEYNIKEVEGMVGIGDEIYERKTAATPRKRIERSSMMT
ncbi:hypothetical protein AXX17_AT4G17020 [Arabidopsis thaliana]|uniref:Uncharacterized protein n=1 Tax=Arabidopsis thaliana TaxID=3702 RepID=A0A178UX61_ARATH|nr:hypothetical protein AXX17_AT4G17020 [Arabidopsis thaliana]